MKVEFTYDGAPGLDVKLIADFNDWKSIDMQDISGNGHYCVSAELVPGKYQYKFIVCGTFIADPKSLHPPTGPYGNSICIVPDSCGVPKSSYDSPKERTILRSELVATLHAPMQNLVDNIKRGSSKVSENIENDSKAYSVAVVATMSAGKSTLLNAMIGERLLPSKNEACTAKVYSIVDDDEAVNFMVRKIEQKRPGSWEPASPTLLKNYNNSSAEKIEIRGNIEQIRNMRNGHAVLFYDTPGPNNSRDKSHSEITEEIIRESGFCSLLCVLNATQMGTDDEFALLSFIRKEIEKKDSKTDVLFILNKIDEFSLADGESIRESLDICKKHLRDRIGFCNVNIVPISSMIALMIRTLLKSPLPMSKAEVRSIYSNKILPNDHFFTSALSEDDQEILAIKLRAFLRHKRSYGSAMSFSPRIKRIFVRLKLKSESAKKRRDYFLIAGRFFTLNDINTVLLLTGIPVVEKYIENKLKKAAK